MMATPPFLAVAHSFSGRSWQARPAENRLIETLAQHHGLPEIISRILAGRGIGPEQVATFLNPSLRAQLPDPSHLKDMDQAATRLAAAIIADHPVAVFGDYDVDGATSSALLARFFQAAGRSARLYIPDRLKEGYGPNPEALRRLQAEGIRLVVTVDCGITAFAALEAAAAVGLEVVVVDHHAAEPQLPPALAVINPNRLDEDSSQGTLAAVGVTFLLVVAVNRELRRKGWYAQNNLPEPDLMSWLDLVALGTICDVVPLVGLNRALVRQGLKVLARRSNPGLAALADVAGIRERPEAFHAGFVLGPRVNAGGRVGEAGLGARLLTCDNHFEAEHIAKQLDDYNTERKAVEAAVLEQAIETWSRHPDPDAPLILAVGEDWHPGVVGIVASRLKERWHRPACVVGLSGPVGKASGRSVPGLDLGAAVIAARQAGLLLAGGGHAMAAGFTVARDNLDSLRVFLTTHIRQQQERQPHDGLRQPILNLDGVLSPAGAGRELLAHLERLAPFGTGNSEPRFALADVRLAFADVVGGQHVRCSLSGLDGSRLKAIAFRAAETDLGRHLLRHAKGPLLHVAGTLRLDRWNGTETVQLVIDDAALAQSRP